MLTTLVASLALMTTGSIQQPSAPVTPAQTAFESAEQLLDALETADAGIDSFSSQIQYTRLFAIAGDTQVRRGLIALDNRRSGPRVDRRFSVVFNQLVVGDRAQQEMQRYIFDGRFLTEIIVADKQFTQREIVREGETFDPLAIGEGPFPVPIGQKKEQILSRFEVELVPTLVGLEEFDESIKQWAQALAMPQLKLTPREGTAESEDFTEIRIWYNPRAGLLPAVVRAIEPTEDESLVVLLNPTINEPLIPEFFDTRPPPEGSGWNVHIARLPEAKIPDGTSDRPSEERRGEGGQR